MQHGFIATDRGLQRAGRQARSLAAVIVSASLALAASIFAAPLGFAATGSWTAVSSPNAGTGPNYDDSLRGTACATASDCWAVGFNNTASPGTTLTEQNAGSGWNIVSSPNPSNSSGSELLAVSCVAVKNCWAAGDYYTASPSQFKQTLIEHWNGSAWKVVSSPNASTFGNQLSGVACVTASECWAVGYYSTNPFSAPQQTLVEKYNGSSWSIVTSPNPTNGNPNLQAIACVNASDCWATGTSFNGVADQTLIVHYNGSSWSLVSSPSVTGANSILTGVSCSAISYCVAAGYANATGTTTLIEQYNGSAWNIVSSPNGSTSGQVINYLNGVTCSNAKFCVAAGYYYSGSAYLSLIEQSTGGGWSIAGGGNPGTYNLLYGVSCNSGCVAVGGQNTPTSFSSTLIEQYGPDSTKTSVSCTPNPDAVNTPTTCTAHVLDTLIPLNRPTGTVSWSGGIGQFSPTTCTLSSGRCSVTFTPSSATSQTVAATYGGDAGHVGSQGSTTLQVT
jgi:hypothetical protein